MNKNNPFLILINEKNEQTIITLNKWLVYTLNIFKLHINYQYSLLTCLSGVDLLNNTYRFSISYELLSLCYNNRIRIKTFVNEFDTVLSVNLIFINSNWWEREIWDMFGIYFKNHYDLRRILSDYGFEGFPLRKNFPLSGFVETRYDPLKKKISIEPLSLTQEYRSYNFLLPWKY